MRIFRNSVLRQFLHPFFSSACNDTDSGKSDRGFAVPYVLTVILILSLITIFSLERQSRASQFFQDLQAKQASMQNLDTAQSQAAFMLLTASLSIDGFDIGGGVSGDALDFGFETQSETYVKDIWVPNGSWRKFGSVYVALQDELGLFPLNTASEKSVSVLFESFGIDSQLAKTLSAEFKDFVDEDSSLTYLGAEAVQYRQAGLSPPSNAPIMDWSQIPNLKSWSSNGQTIDIDTLTSMTTLSTLQNGVKPEFAPYFLEESLGLGTRNPVLVDDDELSSSESQDNYPSGRFRLTFVTFENKPFLRQVYGRRLLNDVEKPLEIGVLYERSLTSEEVSILKSQIEKDLD